MKRVFLSALLIVGIVTFAVAQDRSKLPQPDPAFNGKVSPAREGSKPDWPQHVKAHPGAPNVVLILLDDVDVGYDRGSPVSASYSSPFAFAGEVESVKIELR